MSFSEIEQSQIRNLVQSPQWKTIMALSELLMSKIRENSTLRDTSEETLKETIHQDGKIEGIKLFISEIYRQAQ